MVAARSDRSVEKGRKLWALAALIGVTALDIFTATCLSSEKGGVRTARADYHDRSGFPKGLQAARGAAREFAGDRRGLEAMRSRTSETAKPLSPANVTPSIVPNRSICLTVEVVDAKVC